MALIEIAGLRYRYPGASGSALHDVELVLDGGLCLVTGASGGGKSTLLRLLNGIVPHLHGGRIGGRAVVAGLDVLRTPTRRLATSVGFVFQDAERQAVHAVVERDIAFGLENLAVPAAQIRRRVDAVMERLQISHLRLRSIASLSGGERQRVAVAGALALEPRLLVLDEPFSQLDARGCAALLALCRELRDTGTTVALSEHRLDDLLVAADAVVDVDGGRVTGPAPALHMAAGLASAPQVVRLSAVLGLSPPYLDPTRLRLPPVAWPAHDRLRGRPVGGAPAWCLEEVSAGPDDLLTAVSAGGAAGEVVGLMGRNGAGKTTLLRLIAGLLRPRSGRAWRAAGRIAYLPQDPAALLHRETVAAEIAWTVRAARSRARADVPRDDQLLELLGVAALFDRDPRDLSSGERQRAAIAAVLSGAPTLALLDEPTRGMDGPARDGLSAAVRVLADRGTAVVMATHDAELAAVTTDRVLVLGDGAIDDRGTPGAALSGPGNELATQLGGLFASPGPVTVDAVAELLGAALAPAVSR